MLIKLLIFIIGVIGVWVGYTIARKKYSHTRTSVLGTSSLSFGRNKDEEEARKNMDKVMGMFETDPELTNDEIQKRLGVSDRTAVRYMDRLEKEGKVKQVGTTGRSVTYRKS